MTAVVNQTQCTGCGECVSTCPLDAIALKDDQDGKAFIDPDTCGECGACVDVCPVGAISL
jgi:ferredoxin